VTTSGAGHPDWPPLLKVKRGCDSVGHWARDLLIAATTGCFSRSTTR
jgi:hypothetical protein